MRQRSAECGEYLPIEEINSVQNKDARIQSLQPFVKNGYIKFSKKHKTLIDQMLKYPMGKNDDAPDALQMAVALALSVKVGRKVEYKSVQGPAPSSSGAGHFRRWGKLTSKRIPSSTGTASPCSGRWSRKAWTQLSPTRPMVSILKRGGQGKLSRTTKPLLFGSFTMLFAFSKPGILAEVLSSVLPAGTWSTPSSRP